MRAGFLLAVLLLATSLAGCSDTPAPPEEVEPQFHNLDLKPTSSTGIIRGVVVDAAVVPVADATVVIVGTDRTTTTNAEGVFGFDTVPPGEHFVQVTKPGYRSAQQSASVVAGKEAPPVLKILLERDPVTAPGFEVLQFKGFIECSVSVVAVGFALCNFVQGYTGQGNDVFMAEYDLMRVPDFVQSEMVWESTQAAGDRMTLLLSAPGESALYDNYAEAEGTSPLVVAANRTALEEYGVGAGQTLLIRVFNAPIEGTRPMDPTTGECIPRPALGGCLTGLGATYNQEFTVFSHVFHNMVPEEGWQFSVDGDPSLP